MHGCATQLKVLRLILELFDENDGLIAKNPVLFIAVYTACSISDETLKSMSTADVINAVLSFPLLVNLYAYDSYYIALAELAKDSDAFSELLKREDAIEKLNAASFRLLTRLNLRVNHPARSFPCLPTRASILLRNPVFTGLCEKQENSIIVDEQSNREASLKSGFASPKKEPDLYLLVRAAVNSGFWTCHPYGH